ncbi:MAG: hypothetical protein FJX35_19410 [Alphaproteobacteria bacterium]|nr:hypothetical protein [Alphaproteobacteria bacterium]
MGDVSKWIVGAAVAVLALIGLIVAAKAQDSTMYWVGLAIFVFAIGFIFNMVKRNFDAADQKP